MKKKLFLIPVLAMGLLVAIPTISAHAYEPKSLLTDDMKTQLSNDSADMKKTAGEVLVISTGAGLGIWGMSFPVKKVIRVVQKKAGRAM